MLEQMLVVMAVTVLALVLTTVAVIGVFTVRRVRRVSRSARDTCRRVGATITSGRRLDPARARRQGASPTRSSAITATTRATLGSPGWWPAQRDRRQLWRSVTAAEHAVRVAQRSNVTVGDLPILATQLHTAARGVDSVLRASTHVGALRAQARRDARGIESAARDIHRAALDSLRATATADTEPMLSAIRTEVAALAAGARATRNFPRLPAA
jgi:hypothetical protein